MASNVRGTGIESHLGHYWGVRFVHPDSGSIIIFEMKVNLKENILNILESLSKLVYKMIFYGIMLLFHKLYFM